MPFLGSFCFVRDYKAYFQVFIRFLLKIIAKKFLAFSEINIFIYYFENLHKSVNYYKGQQMAT